MCAGINDEIGKAGTLEIGEDPARTLSFHDPHTGRQLTSTYWENGGYIKDSLNEISEFLKDRRTGDVHDINPQSLDRLHEIQGVLKGQNPSAEYDFELVSAYRSPKTNESLRSAGGGQANPCIWKVMP
jgi:uncharacterized protein YcbK (DUF882 family)